MCKNSKKMMKIVVKYVLIKDVIVKCNLFFICSNRNQKDTYDSAMYCTIKA